MFDFLSDTFQSIFDPGSTDLARANKRLEGILANNQRMLQEYRPRQMQANIGAGQAALGTMGPGNDLLMQMYGQQYGQNLQGLQNALGQYGDTLLPPGSVPTQEQQTGDAIKAFLGFMGQSPDRPTPQAPQAGDFVNRFIGGNG